MKLDLKHYVLSAIIVVLAIFLLTKNCGAETTTKITIKDKEVTIPEVEGEFKKPTKQTETPLSEPDTIEVGVPVYVQSPLDKKVKEELEKAKDSLQKFKILIDAARKREYNSNFSDEYVDINVNTTVYGNLDKNEIKYKLKERKVTVKETLVEKTTVKKNNFGVLLLTGVSTNLDTQKQVYEAGAGVRFKNFSVLGTATTAKTVGIKTIIEF